MVDVFILMILSWSVMVPFSVGLGPNVMTVVKLSVGGKDDLFVGSIYNSPEQNEMMLLRNDGAEFPKLAEEQLAGPFTKANRFFPKSGGAELVCELVTDDKKTTLHV